MAMNTAIWLDDEIANTLDALIELEEGKGDPQQAQVQQQRSLPGQHRCCGRLRGCSRGTRRSTRISPTHRWQSAGPRDQRKRRRDGLGTTYPRQTGSIDLKLRRTRTQLSSATGSRNRTTLF